MNGSETGWRISKEIPIALLATIAGSLFLGGLSYQALKSDIGTLAESQKEARAEVKEVKDDVRGLSGKMQDGTVPTALSASRVSAVETSLAELRGRVLENERKILRFEAVLNAQETQARRGSNELKGARQ